MFSKGVFFKNGRTPREVGLPESPSSSLTEKLIFKDCTACELGIKHEVKSSYIFGEKWHLILEGNIHFNLHDTLHHITNKRTGKAIR